MLLSMTGYASAVTRYQLPQGDTLTMTISIKALNSRFFELSVKSPYAFSAYELEFQKLLKEKLTRGHLYLTIHVADVAALKNKVSASTTLAHGYITELQKLQQELQLPGQITINDLLRITSLFSVEEQELGDEVKAVVMKAVAQVADVVKTMRATEGAALARDIQERITRIKIGTERIEKRFLVVFEQRRLELEEKLAQLATQHTTKEAIDSHRSLLYAGFEKLDVHEELVRLRTHLAHLEQMINDDREEKGRQLDFMVQELARETNTIAAKSIDAEVTQEAVQLKVEIEKAREQVQNIL